MPGVLTIEAMAQTGAILSLIERSPEELKNAAVYLTGIDEARFRKPVVPGDQLRIVVEVLRRKASVWKMRGQAFVGEDLAAEATLMASVGQQP
jgi:3-hydroxymyristoyl/3-hydroxydecanoyl-(acyl carrier protein) dehydratase